MKKNSNYAKLQGEITMESAMDLTKKHFDQIENFVQKNLKSWAKNLSLVRDDLDFQRQTLTLESELKHQREIILEGFKQSDKRFEHIQHNMDKRFEQVQHNMDKRFEQVQHNMDKRFFESREDFKNMFNFMKWQTGLGFVMVAGIYVKMFIE